MLTIFKYNSETDSTFIWSSEREGSSTVFQIKRWRVPEPLPRYIEVGIFSRDNFMVKNHGGKEKYSLNPASRVEDIVWNVIRSQVNSDSIVYITEESCSPFESITIPNYLIKGMEEDEKLQVFVRWLREKEGDPNILVPIIRSLNNHI